MHIYYTKNQKKDEEKKIRDDTCLVMEELSCFSQSMPVVLQTCIKYMNDIGGGINSLKKTKKEPHAGINID